MTAVRKTDAVALFAPDGARLPSQTIFLHLLSTRHVPPPIFEYHFHPTRQWRFDVAWPDALVALEVEGGVYSHGRHTRGSGFVKDMEKYNEAALLGWRLLRIQPKQLATYATVDLVQRALRGVPDPA